MIALLLAMAAGQAPVSYSREVAPVLAFHCHRCHEGPGLNTRTYAGLLQGGNLGPAVIAGDPERSPLVQFIEGRRGEARRMPLGGPPLGTEQVALIRRWVAEGAREDPDTTPKYQVKLEGVRRGRLAIEARSPVAAYLVLSVRDRESVLLERAVAGVSGSWTVRPEQGWPRRLTVVLTIAYPEADPVGATLTVNGRRKTVEY
jgi:mono/diheme cytochrome c family protein